MNFFTFQLLVGSTGIYCTADTFVIQFLASKKKKNTDRYQSKIQMIRTFLENNTAANSSQRNMTFFIFCIKNEWTR